MARHPSASAEFVESFLATGSATEADIDRLLTARAPEGVQLEYKGGDWLSAKEQAERGRPIKAGPRIAAWSSSFANTAGGVLLVGVDKDPAVPGLPGSVNRQTCAVWGSTRVKDASDLRARATDALRPLAARHVVPPRIDAIAHRDGLVLAIGVERAPELIPCEEPGGAPVYYVRTFDGTTALADVVAADLLVGRRARPTIGLRAHLQQGNAGPQGFNLKINLTICNDGLVWVDDVRAGVVFRSAGCRDARVSLEPRFARAIETAEPFCVLHVPAREANDRWGALPPMAEVTSLASASLPGREGRFSLAVYVVARGHPPSWWQVDGEIEHLPSNALLLSAEWEVTPCHGERPRVAFAPTD